MEQDLKSSQKLTELPEPTNAKELLERLNEQYPQPPEGATETQKQERLDAILNGLLESPFQTEEQKQSIRNQTWEKNHNRLTEQINYRMRKSGRMPTINELAEKTGLSRQTIIKHLKSFHQSATYQDQLQGFRLLTTKVLGMIYGQAMEGDIKAAKVYLDAVGGLPGLQTTDPVPADNYIQINNSIKINQIIFTQLPESVQQQIAGLVLRGLQMGVSTPTDSDQSDTTAKSL